MLYLSPLLFIITAVVLVLTLFAFKKLGGLSRKFYREQQAALGAVNGAVQEDDRGPEGRQGLHPRGRHQGGV